MSLPNTLRLDTLSLRNYRCFGECTINLHQKLTVLVADNSQGKTAVLDAIGIALGLFVDTLANTHQSHGFEGSDIRMALNQDGKMRAMLPTEFVAYGMVDGQRLRWSRSLTKHSQRARTSTKDADELREIALGLRSRLLSFADGGLEQPPPLPLVAFYGTGRLWSEHRLTEWKRAPDTSSMGRLSGYVDCLSSSSSFKSFVAWYEETVRAVQAPPASFAQNERPERLLAAVRDATRVVLEPTGWQGLDWDFEQRGLVVEHQAHGRLPLSVLSDGVRNMIALVADVAHRCVRLNPHFGEHAARLTPGVLLIDEVDMHLHPRWQQLVVQALSRVFPAMQIILSTHSPHVLSTVDVESIRVIRLQGGKGILETPQFQTRGVESADVLAAIMGVDPVPQVEEAKMLRAYQAMIEEGRAESEVGLKLRASLVEHFGAMHPVMLDCERLLRFKSFKLRVQASKKEGELKDA